MASLDEASPPEPQEAGVQRSSSLELEEEDKEELLDEELWRARKAEYEAQIVGLEEEQATLRDAWSDIVRDNLSTVDDLKRTPPAARSSATRPGRRATRSSPSSRRSRTTSSRSWPPRSCGPRLSDARDRAHHDLGALAKSPTQR
ncbi:hypothetical protein JL720_14967 [Aureococcus anophagefferens]|nr:hypothetical protein JL720_14967 [Aureococcus anophagefferens]